MSEIFNSPAEGRACKNAIKGCPNACDSEITPDMCEACRAVFNRDAFALIYDVTQPNAQTFVPQVLNRLITTMSGAEFVARRIHEELVYTEMCKVMAIHGIARTPKRAAKTLEEQIAEAHASQKTVTTTAKRMREAQTEAKKHTKKKQSVAKLLGMTDAEAQKFMTEEVDL